MKRKSPTNELAAHAVQLSNALGGVPVFPVLVAPDPEKPGKTKKTPLVTGWTNGGAAKGEKSIEEMFGKKTEANAVGIPTGSHTGLLLIDADTPEAESWLRENGVLFPQTRLQKTQRGKHLFYRIPADVVLQGSTSKIYDHVDVRAEGGFACDWSQKYPPNEKGYAPIVDAPTALIELIRSAASRPSKGEAAVEVFGDGKRNDGMASVAGKLRHTALPVAVRRNALHDANASMCRPPLPRHEIDKIFNSYERYPASPKPEAPVIVKPSRSPIEWRALHDLTPPERDWAVTYWAAMNTTTLLAGKEGLGKTFIAHTLATALAIKREFFAQIPQQRRVLMWAGEDDRDEMWRRQIAINRHFDIDMSALDALVVQSYVDEDITLAAPAFGVLAPTPAMEALREQVGDYKAEVVILDTTARIYGGNENDRTSVTRFLAWLRAACGSAAVILLSHPAKAQGSEWSGSTAWSGSVRSRLWLTDAAPGEKESDADPTPDATRYLARRKANYAPTDCVQFKFENGVFVPEEDFDGGPVAAPTNDEMRAQVRVAVTKLLEMDMYGVSSTSSPNWLPKLAARFKQLGRLSQKQFLAAMTNMQLAGELKTKVVGKNTNRTDRHGLVLA